MIRWIQALVVVGLFVLFVSCSKSGGTNTVTDFKLSKSQVNDFLGDTNKVIPMDGAVAADAEYALPTLGWIKGDFSSAFNSFKFQLGNSQWHSESNDCDDFARFAAFFAQYLHHNTTRKLANTGLCFGEFWYVTTAGTGHAINVFLYRENEKVKLGFFEPQTGAVVNLTKQEIESCSFYRF